MRFHCGVFIHAQIFSNTWIIYIWKGSLLVCWQLSVPRETRTIWVPAAALSTCQQRQSIVIASLYAMQVKMTLALHAFWDASWWRYSGTVFPLIRGSSISLKIHIDRGRGGREWPTCLKSVKLYVVFTVLTYLEVCILLNWWETDHLCGILMVFVTVWFLHQQEVEFYGWQICW